MRGGAAKSACGTHQLRRCSCVNGSPDPSKFHGRVDAGFNTGILNKRTVVRDPKVARAPVPV